MQIQTLFSYINSNSDQIEIERNSKLVYGLPLADRRKNDFYRKRL